MTTSNRIVILEAPEEEILDIPEFDDGAFVHFFEPDLGDACTAVAVMSSTGSKYLTHLPLYGKGGEKMKTVEERNRELMKRNRELQDQIWMLQMQDGELSTEQQSWLQMKVASQRKALDTLNRKVVSQRFRLRVLQEIGRDLTKDEYLAARDAIQSEQVKDRIEDYAPVA